MKKWLSCVFLSIFLCAYSVANATSIKIADREMKSIPREESGFADRINTILATGGEEISGRVKLGLLLHGDGHIYIDDEVKKIIYKKLREKFPKEEFALIKATDVATLLLQKGDKQRKMLPEMAEGDYVVASRECNYDYLLVISFIHDETWNGNLMQSTDGGEETVWMKIRLISPSTGGYVYRNDFSVTGNYTKNHVRCHVKPEVVASMTQEVLDDLSIDYRNESWFQEQEAANADTNAEETKRSEMSAHDAEVDAILGGAL